jgi:hypothetical protein
LVASKNKSAYPTEFPTSFVEAWQHLYADAGIPNSSAPQPTVERPVLQVPSSASTPVIATNSSFNSSVSSQAWEVPARPYPIITTSSCH